MYKETFIIDEVKYQIGDHISCAIMQGDGTLCTIKDARLNREGEFFFLCQNFIEGLDCMEKFGYRYSYAIVASEFGAFCIQKINKDCFIDIIQTAFPKG